MRSAAVAVSGRVQARGHEYQRPLEYMRGYLDAMDAARYDAPGERRPPRVLAALGDGMLRLAAERADGAHSYFVPVEHTARARAVLGPDPFLAVEQTVVLDTDPSSARAVGRAFAGHYLELSNYGNYVAILSSGQRVSVSRSFRDRLPALLGA